MRKAAETSCKKNFSALDEEEHLNMGHIAIVMCTQHDPSASDYHKISFKIRIKFAEIFFSAFLPFIFFSIVMTLQSALLDLFGR